MGHHDVLDLSESDFFDVRVVIESGCLELIVDTHAIVSYLYLYFVISRSCHSYADSSIPNGKSYSVVHQDMDSASEFRYSNVGIQFLRSREECYLGFVSSGLLVVFTDMAE